MLRPAAIGVVLALVMSGCARQASPPPAESKDPAMLTKAGYDETRDPAKDLEALVVQARAEHKRILLVVGGEWCIWCHYLHNFIDKEADIARLWNDNFLTLHVNFSPDHENKAFLSQYPKIPGYPHIFVLEQDGALLQSQDTSLLESGRGYSKDAVRAFLEKWRAA